MTTIRRAFAIIAVALAVAAFTACENDDETGGTTTTIETRSPRPTRPATSEDSVAVETIQSGTPQACLDALDYADEGFGIASEFGDAASGIVGEFQATLEAIMAGDVAGVEASTDRLVTINDDVTDINERLTALSPKYLDAKTECREGAE